MTRRRPPSAHVVVTATLALFLTVFALLVFQLRSGHDPALGAGPVARVASPPPKHVLVRNLIVTRVIVHLPGKDENFSVPVTRTAVVPVAPAAAPAPVPAAPAPAPLTTHSS